MSNTHKIYLVSDSTGETIERIFTALKSQFSNFKYETQQYSFTRTKNQISEIIKSIKKKRENNNIVHLS